MARSWQWNVDKAEQGESPVKSETRDNGTALQSRSGVCSTVLSSPIQTDIKTVLFAAITFAAIRRHTGWWPATVAISTGCPTVSVPTLIADISVKRCSIRKSF